ncbi:hypothetical protein [Actinophytocola sp. KF-1]
MSWQRTHDWWRAVREAEAALTRDPDGDLPWHADWADLFGDRRGLLLALRYRWSLLVAAQLDPELPEHVRERTWRDLTTRHAGLLRALDRFAEPAATRRHA